MGKRYPAVAGYFYPSDKEELINLIKECFTHRIGPGKLPPKPEVSKALAFICPHAGYIYSGPVAAHSYYWASSIKDVELVVIVGPNHYGIGSGIAIFREGSWLTPLGEVEIDKEGAKELVKISGIVDYDEEAHLREHSLEVQIPFLQFIYSHKFKILPICINLQDKYTALELGKALAELLRNYKKFILIASSDLTHYEPYERAKEKDLKLLEQVLKMDITSYYTVLERLNVTACGYGAIATIMEACRELKATKVELLKYANSGDTAGDKSSVVGYPSVMFSFKDE